MDVAGQVEYWKTGSEEDLAAAESLFEEGHFRHCLFCAHLALEKMLKAHVVRGTCDVPPRIHNLVRLAHLAGLKLDDERERFLRRFDLHQLEGRYPDSEHVALHDSLVRQELRTATEVLEWLKTQLSTQ